MDNAITRAKQLFAHRRRNNGAERQTAAAESDSERIRVLLVITGLSAGGATNVVLDLASHFSNHPAFELRLLAGPPPRGRTDVTYLAHGRGIDTRIIPSLVNRLNPVTNLAAVAQLRRIMVEGHYDIVHTHSSVAGVVGRLAAFAAGVPVVIHHVHGWALHDEMSFWLRKFYLSLEAVCATLTTRLVVVSPTDIHKGLTNRIGKAEKYSLIYNGIDLRNFQGSVDDEQMRRALGLAPECKLVGMIGRLDRQKNPLDFIRVAAIVARTRPDVQFVILGDGPLRPDCERLIDALDLKGKVLLLGYRSDVNRIVPILTITAMSSLWEGLPIAFLESMSAGKPIVANDVDGARDVVTDGETGFLVTPRSPEHMAERILRLLNDERLCRQMGRVAQKRSKHFSLQRMLGQVERLYKELHFAASTPPHRRGQPVPSFLRSPVSGVLAEDAQNPELR